MIDCDDNILTVQLPLETISYRSFIMEEKSKYLRFLGMFQTKQKTEKKNDTTLVLLKNKKLNYEVSAMIFLHGTLVGTLIYTSSNGSFGPFQTVLNSIRENPGPRHTVEYYLNFAKVHYEKMHYSKALKYVAGGLLLDDQNLQLKRIARTIYKKKAEL